MESVRLSSWNHPSLPNPSGRDQTIDGPEAMESTSGIWLENQEPGVMVLAFGDGRAGRDRGEANNRPVWTPRANHTLPLNGDITMTNDNGTKKGGSTQPAVTATPRAEALFELGEIYLTRGVLETVPIQDVSRSLGRHVRGDWGNLDPLDWRENELALEHGEGLLSVYRASNGVKFWISTEWNRSRTTVLLPEEY